MSKRKIIGCILGCFACLLYVASLVLHNNLKYEGNGSVSYLWNNLFFKFYGIAILLIIISVVIFFGIKGLFSFLHDLYGDYPIILKVSAGLFWIFLLCILCYFSFDSIRDITNIGLDIKYKQHEQVVGTITEIVEEEGTETIYYISDDNTKDEEYYFKTDLEITKSDYKGKRVIFTYWKHSGYLISVNYVE